VGHKFIIVFCLGAAGCAASHQAPVAEQIDHYQEASAAALVFDLPIDRGVPHPELARAGRASSAFMGFDLPTTESYISATDTVSTELGDFHTQESVSVKSGTRVR
jgi:hypothetical protein